MCLVFSKKGERRENNNIALLSKGFLLFSFSSIRWVGSFVNGWRRWQGKSLKLLYGYAQTRQQFRFCCAYTDVRRNRYYDYYIILSSLAQCWWEHKKSIYCTFYLWPCEWLYGTDERASLITLFGDGHCVNTMWPFPSKMRIPSNEQFFSINWFSVLFISRYVRPEKWLKVNLCDARNQKIPVPVIWSHESVTVRVRATHSFHSDSLSQLCCQQTNIKKENKNGNPFGSSWTDTRWRYVHETKLS